MFRVTDPPRDTEPPPVMPVPAVTVTAEFVSPAFGMPVKFVPVRVGVVEYEGVVPPTRTPEPVARIDVAPTPV
jgi:hypothetical protein